MAESVAPPDTELVALGGWRLYLVFRYCGQSREQARDSTERAKASRPGSA